MPPDRHTEAAPIAHRVLTEYGVEAIELIPITEGLINLTWRVQSSSGGCFILQRLHAISPPSVNLNLREVTAHLAARGRVTPQLVATTVGAWWVDDGRAIWRLQTFVDGRSFAILPDLAHATAAGCLLGDFHRALSDFTKELPCPRAPMHAPLRHFAALETALTTSNHRLLHEVRLLALVITQAFNGMPEIPAQPLRLVHGDPKLSNLLFGSFATPRCLVDLDTVGFAPLAYELGDAFRSWCNPEPEDGIEARFNLTLFTAALEGYAAVADFISASEIDAIVPATEVIYLELAARFATDAINESYFGWDPARFANRGEHNLVRARNQLQAARSLHAQRADAEAAVRRAFGAHSSRPS